MTAHKTTSPTFFFFLKCKVPGFRRHINKFTVLDAKAKMQIFTSWSRWVQRWFSLNMCLLRMHTTNRDVFDVFNFWCMLPKKNKTKQKKPMLEFLVVLEAISELGKKWSLDTCLFVLINNVNLTTKLVHFFHYFKYGCFHFFAHCQEPPCYSNGD